MIRRTRLRNASLEESRTFSREYLVQRALRQLLYRSAHADFFLRPAGNVRGREVSLFMVNRHGVDQPGAALKSAPHPEHLFPS
jgi:hypothetical protein